MNLHTLVNLGLGAAIVEYCYSEQLIRRQRAYLLPYIDIPQHIISYAIGASILGKARALPLLLLPFGFKASLILSDFKYRQESDHLNRLASKITILVGSILLLQTSANKVFASIRIFLIAIATFENLITLLQHDPSKESFNDYLASRTLASLQEV